MLEMKPQTSSGTNESLSKKAPYALVNIVKPTFSRIDTVLS